MPSLPALKIFAVQTAAKWSIPIFPTNALSSEIYGVAGAVSFSAPAFRQVCPTESAVSSGYQIGLTPRLRDTAKNAA
jgi:hypothetical protein